MDIKPFFTERYFAVHEFSAPYLLCASDCESLTVDKLLQMAGVSRQTFDQLWLGYTESQGAPSLRQRIAELYAQVQADQIIGPVAPEEGIFLTLHALLKAGDEVVVLTPCYDSLVNLVEYLGCRVKRWAFRQNATVADRAPTPGNRRRGSRLRRKERWSFRPAATGWRLDLDELESLVTSNTKLVIVNFPHNPTGYLPAPKEWRGIVRIVEQAGAWLFSDEMYRGLEYDPGARLPSGCDLYERAITLCGLSKAYGLPGLRVGWLALQDAGLRDRILGWKDYTTICASAPSEALAEVALQAGEQLTARSRRTVLDNLALAEPFFARWGEIFRWNRPRAGSVALVGLHGRSAKVFCSDLVAEQGVLLLSSTGFGFGDGHVRFGFGRRSFPEALEQLDLCLANL